MLLGYVRVSTKEQNEARQIEALKTKGVEDKHIYIDKQSGKNADRPQLKALLAFAREGDVIITESFSRIARNIRDLLSIVDELQSKDISFISLKENIDTTTPQGKLMLTIFGALAEFEREQMLERQREGIEIARQSNTYQGRAKKEIDETAFAEAVKLWRAGTITATEAMKRCDLKPNTFYRRVNERGL